jgi:hypothetical protein
MPKPKSTNEAAALALLKQYAASDLENRLKLYALDSPDKSASDLSTRRAALRDCLDDLARDEE